MGEYCVVCECKEWSVWLKEHCKYSVLNVEDIIEVTDLTQLWWFVGKDGANYYQEHR
jgi:hypothetical protein